MSDLTRTATAQTTHPSQSPPPSGLLQRQCACGQHTAAGGECAACRQKRQGALQRSPSGLAINRPGDRYEQEAERVAAAVLSDGELPGRTLSSAPALRRDGPPAAPSPRDPSADERRKYSGASLPDLGFNEPKNDQHVQQPSEKTETNEDRLGAAGEKLAETFLETTLGKQLSDQAEKFGEGFVSTLPGLAVSLSIAASTVATMALRNEEFPLKGLVIKLPQLAPGLKVKLTYKGPLSAPTEAGISFAYEPEAAKKPQMSDTDRTRADTERLAADQAKFQKGAKTPAERAAEQRQLDAIVRGRQAQSGNILGIPGLTPRRDDRTLQRDAAGSSDLALAPPIVHDVLSSPGQPLDPATRSFMEPRFGHDFSGVRVHTDGRAAASARDVSANAYTVGHNVVFGAGRFAPETHEGRRLIAHELTHVVQQTGPDGIRVGQSNEERVLSSIATVNVTGSKRVGLARTEDVDTGPTIARFGQEEVDELTDFWKRNIEKEHDPETKKLYKKYITNLEKRGVVLGSKKEGNLGKQSEAEITHLHSLIGGTGPRAYKAGRNVEMQGAAGPKGSTVPDYTTPNVLGEVKNFKVFLPDLDSDAAEANLKKLEKQIADRREYGPFNVKQQTVTLDIRGQKPSPQQLQDLGKTVAERTGLPIKNIQIVIWDMPEPSKAGSAKPAITPLSPVKPIATPVTAPAAEKPAQAKPAPLVSTSDPAAIKPVRPAGKPSAMSSPSQPSPPATKLATPGSSGTIASGNSNEAKVPVPRGGAIRNVAVQGGIVTGTILLGLVDAYIKSKLDEKEIGKGLAAGWPAVEQQIHALSPQIASLKAKPDSANVYAVIDVAVLRARFFFGERVSEGAAAIESISVAGVSTTNTQVEPHDVMSRDPSDGVFSRKTEFTFSVSLWNRVQEQADLRAKEIERQEQLLRERMRSLAGENKSGTQTPQGRTQSPESQRPIPLPARLLSPQQAQSPSYLPGAPARSLDQEAWAAYARGFGDQLLAEGFRLRTTRTTDTDRQRFKLKVQVWRGQMRKVIQEFGNFKAKDSLMTTLLQFDERMESLGSELGIDGWKDE